MGISFDKRRRKPGGGEGGGGGGRAAWTILHVLLLDQVLCGRRWMKVGCAAGAAASSDTIATINLVRREGVDSSLRKYAFLAFSNGQYNADAARVYNVTLTPSLQAGIESQALRLPSSSKLQQQGLTFNEIAIPQGALFSPSSSSSPLLLIYRKISNFTVYSLPPSYSFAGPVVGVIAYAPPNFTTDDPSLPQLPIFFSTPSITATLPLFISDAPSTSLSCAFFAPNGSVSIAATFSSPNVCISSSLGVDVALVLPTQDMLPLAPPLIDSNGGGMDPPAFLHSKSSSSSSSRNKHWKLAVGATCLALAGLGFCVALAVASVGFAHRLKVMIVARLTGRNEEALQTSLIGVSRAPSAPALRTKPALEMDMARF